MMRLLLSTVVILSASCVSSSSSLPAFSRSITGHSLFGITRGGGLFGGKDETKENEKTAVAEGERQKYPALTREEVEEWLEHVPVFAVTDGNGAGVVLKPDNDTSVLYFFMNPLMANATLQQLKSVNKDIELRVSAFSLGKIWFKLLSSDASEKEVMLKNPNGEGDGTVAKGVQYRLVPDTRDLLGARMLLTMTPEDGEKLRESGQMTPELAQAAIQKAMTEATKFNSTFNEIPVFMIAQMRMQKKLEEGEIGEPVTLLPMYFSMQSMVGTWQQFMSQAPQELQGVEPAINLMALHDLVEMMQKESEIDFRNVVLVPPTPLSMNGGEGPAAATDVDDPMAKMGGSTLGDL